MGVYPRVEPAVAAALASASRGPECISLPDEVHGRSCADQCRAVQARAPSWRVPAELEQLSRGVGSWLQQSGSRSQPDGKACLQYQTLEQLFRAIYTARPSLRKSLKHTVSGIAAQIKKWSRKSRPCARHINDSADARWAPHVCTCSGCGIELEQLGFIRRTGWCSMTWLVHSHS